MPILQYGEYADEVLIYFYGRKGSRSLFDHVLARAREIILFDSGFPVNIVMKGAGRLTITNIINGLIVYTGTLTNREILGGTILYVLGALENTIYSADRTLRNFANSGFYLSWVNSNLGNDVTHLETQYPQLNQNEIEQCRNIAANKHEVYKKFYVLVGCYLRRVPTDGDFSSTASIPIVESKAANEAAELLQKPMPLFVKDFLTSMVESERKLSDSATSAKFLPIKPFSNNISSIFDVKIGKVLATDLNDWLIVTMADLKPRKYDYEDRYLWYLRSANKVRNRLHFWFGHEQTHTSKYIRGKMMILKSDKLHSIEAFFEDRLETDKGKSKLISTKELVDEINVLILNEWKSEFGDYEAPRFYVICCYLLYLSIHGTNYRRVHPHLIQWEILINGYFVKISPDKLTRMINTQYRGLNAVRLWARYYSSVTFYIRKMNDINTNNWDRFVDVPQYLCYDVVTYVSPELLTYEEYVAVCMISDFIRNNKRTSRGNILTY
ncbi:Hsp90 [Pistachio ampelovirus A]|uniref:Hsp90 n=1 Tax=Pistachio ampelovirus A TaxID=2093224 RepID=A0A499PLE1_9CLOS|nr:Hsp90 [Pistachio ampelovirus A]AVN99311.1 Hsp90 [Pistachio ampelovirus A]